LLSLFLFSCLLVFHALSSSYLSSKLWKDYHSEKIKKNSGISQHDYNSDLSTSLINDGNHGDDTTFSYILNQSDTNGIDEIYIDKSNHCSFLPSHTNSSYPIPLVLMALGRSGSSVTWDTLSRLMGKEPNVAFEITGGNVEKSQKFMASISPDIGNKWASLKVCTIQNQQRNKNSAIAGFQWKPYENTVQHKYGIGAINEMAKHQNPPIRVIYQKRNPINVILSNLKHRGYVGTGHVKAHCPVGDLKCAQEHNNRSSISVSLTELLQRLEYSQITHDGIEKALIESGISFIQVNYEDLYPLEDNDILGGIEGSAIEWNRLLEFLTSGQHQNVTMKEVKSHFSIMPTHKPRNETVTNWSELEEGLRRHGYGYLLD